MIGTMYDNTRGACFYVVSFNEIFSSIMNINYSIVNKSQLITFERE